MSSFDLDRSLRGDRKIIPPGSASLRDGDFDGRESDASQRNDELSRGQSLGDRRARIDVERYSCSAGLAQYHAVVETSQDGFLMADAEGRLLETNEAYLKLSGYNRHELREKWIGDLEAYETPEAIHERLRLMARTGGGLFRGFHRSKSGRIWEAEVNVSYWPIDGGRFLAFVRDLVKRQRSEMLLKIRVELEDLSNRGSLSDLLRAALDAAERFTGSLVAFFRFVETDPSQTPREEWSTRGARAARSSPSASLAGLLADCLREERSIVCNDLVASPGHQRLPEGYPEMSRLMCVPVVREGTPLAIVGVGNKPEDYTPDDLDLLRDLASLVIGLVLEQARFALCSRIKVEKLR